MEGESESPSQSEPLVGGASWLTTTRPDASYRPEKENDMKRVCKGLGAATLIAAAGITVGASSHREALAILNEPCADNTDTFAWVKPGAHDKLYLVMDFFPLHEPGQGNQGLR